MGGVCASGGGRRKSNNPYASRIVQQGDPYQQQQKTRQVHSEAAVPTQPQVVVVGRKEDVVQVEHELRKPEVVESSLPGYSSSEDEFYDGIPRFRRSSSQKSRSRRVALIQRAGSVGLERAVNVLDTLGNTMNLNINSATNKNSELSILAFEVANTIVKGSNLMQSLSKRNISQLKEVVLLSEGVQQLVSNDMDELLRIIAADKREELNVFAGEVVRFGNRSKDPQWHNLDRFFEKSARERSPRKLMREEAESMRHILMTLVQYTAELYHELHTLDRCEQEYQRMRLEAKLSSSQRGDGLSILAGELKSQKKLVKSLKKKSLWSRSLEEVMEKLVEIALFLNREINNAYGNAENGASEEQSPVTRQSLGPAGLALHFANIILQIDSIVARSSSMTQSSRDTLYQSLPPSIKSSLRSKLASFKVKEELTISEIKDEMEKTLQWLVPVATNTAKAHHGFGWVGEWANAGSESNRKSVAVTDVIIIETLHHADRQKTEAYILDLLLWLHVLVSKSKPSSNRGCMKSPAKPASCSAPNEADNVPLNGRADISNSAAMPVEHHSDNKKQTLLDLDSREDKSKEPQTSTNSSSTTGHKSVPLETQIPDTSVNLGDQKTESSGDIVETNR